MRRRLLVAASLIASGGVLFPLGVPGPASAAGRAVSGAAVIVGRGHAAITSGDALRNPWYVDLPGRASCPGDTATGGYHTFSYVEPVHGGTAPGDITYTPGGPRPPGTTLVDPGGSPYVAVNTSIATSPRGPGPVVNPPEFSWSPYVGSFGASGLAAQKAGDVLYAGTWNIGIACANAEGVTTNYWNAQVRLSEPTANDDFRWTVVSPNGGGTATTSTSTTAGGTGVNGSAHPASPGGTGSSGAGEHPAPGDPSASGSLASTGKNITGLVSVGLAAVAAGWTLTLIARTRWRAARRPTGRVRPGSRAEDTGERSR
jgi:hypothetical protein